MSGCPMLINLCVCQQVSLVHICEEKYEKQFEEVPPPSHLISAFFATAPDEEEGSADRPRFIPFPLQRKFQSVTGLP